MKLETVLRKYKCILPDGPLTHFGVEEKLIYGKGLKKIFKNLNLSECDEFEGVDIQLYDTEKEKYKEYFVIKIGENFKFEKIFNFKTIVIQKIILTEKSVCLHINKEHNKVKIPVYLYNNNPIYNFN